MPPRGCKRKSETDVEEAGNSTSAPGTAPTGGNKKQPAGKKPFKPLREYEADAGRDDAKSFFKSASTANKRRSTAANAKKEIRKMADEALAQSHDSGNSSSHGLDVKALQKLRDDNAAVLKVPRDSKALNNSPTENASIVGQASKVLQQCIESTAAYKSSSKRSTGIKEPDWMRWAQDIRDLRSLNKHAFELAVKIVEHDILGAATGKTKPLQMSRKAGELERLAWEMLEEVMPREGEATWGTVANAQLKALIALGKALGKDEELPSRV